jgi:CBS domain containing-hemolysin-like protein
MEDIPSIFLIFSLILLNGAFVAAEFAIARVRKTQIDQIVESENGLYDKKTKKKAKTLQEILQNMNDYISACQVGITMASLALGAVAEAKIEKLISPWLGSLEYDLNSHGVSIVISVAIISFFHVLLGELVPKNIAIFNPEKTSLYFANFLKLIHGIFKFPIFVLNASSAICLRIIGIDLNENSAAIHSEDEIKLILSASQAEGVLEEEEEQLIRNVFEFNDTVARDIMTPRTDMFCLPYDISIEEAARRTNEVSYSKFPIFQEGLDNIVGYVGLKEILKAYSESKDSDNILSISKDTLKVPDGIYVIDLIKLMQQKKKQMAILIDEYGGTSGLVTVEDIIEEVFGEIDDDNEIPSVPIMKLPGGEYLIDGLVYIKELNEKLGTNLESEHYDTIGGFVFGLIGTEPKDGDQIEYNDIRFVVEKYSDSRVRSIRMLSKRKISEERPIS